ncbi:unnamed protein product [Brachionus calyciflorus]|uniref:UPAR/Ly6 domain-containing protein n=1 Tax=Brachionus calyciflorus TaxID=104777 RepID=A0A813PH27_9BILA|nr:unnamed protein product [Brachionus calyciflorus]
MKKFIVCLISICLLFSFVHDVDCLKCVQCTGECKGTETSTDCPAFTDTCMKVYISLPGLTKTQRACVTTSLCSPSSYGFLGIGFWTTCCTTDGCNSASLSSAKLTTLAISSFISIIFFKMF